MPKAKRDTAIYRRGEFRLDWDRRADGSLRSPNLAVFWYDKSRRRERSVSTGTADHGGAKTFLDAFYLGQTSGEAHCPTCGQRVGSKGYLVTQAITSYIATRPEKLASLSAVKARLAHVVSYIGSLTNKDVVTDQVDEAWVRGFRSWAEGQPIITPTGRRKVRSLSTIEGSVAQLSAAINDAYRRGDTAGPARFKSIPIRELNRTPQHRSAVADIAEMFAYCVAPVAEAGQWGRRKEPHTAAEMAAVRVRERASLHRFLILSVATLGRPDAVHDVSLKPERKQWNSKARILDLNPKGRRQTKKYRATVPIAWQVALHLDAAPKDYFVGAASVSKAWAGMAAELGLPGEGEGGMKLLRRSMADILRQRLPEEAWGEISMFMGHDRTDTVTSLYAPFSPTYLKRALAVVEEVVDEIEAAVPGAFALPASNVEMIGKKA